MEKSKLINTPEHKEYTDKLDMVTRDLFDKLLPKLPCAKYGNTNIQWSEDRYCRYDAVLTFNNKRFMIELKRRMLEHKDYEKFNDIWITQDKVNYLSKWREQGFNGAYIVMFEPNLTKKVYFIKEAKFSDYEKEDTIYTQPYLPDETWVKTPVYCYLKSKLICYDMIKGIKLK
jgi:hypothetical protein